MKPNPWILLGLIVVLLLLFAPTAAVVAEEQAAAPSPEHTFSPFSVGVESGGVQAANRFVCDEPDGVCTSRCECLWPGPGGAFCIFDPALVCYQESCSRAICDFWPE